MLRRSSAVLLLLAATAPAVVEAQGVTDMMGSIRQGGGWVNVPIVAGHGSFRTPTVPSIGMTLQGCVNVWPGHSGAWEIEAKDNVLGETVEMSAEPGIGVPFAHTFGMRTQVDFDFRWSEPRDTTLYLWVGVDTRGEGPESVCEPPLEGGS